MNRRAAMILILAVGAAFLAAAWIFDWNSVNTYESQNTSTRSYVRARVESVKSSKMEEAPEGRQLGEQEVRVRILEGAEKGKTVSTVNYLSYAHNVPVRKGTHVILTVDSPEGTAPMYTIMNYDRSVPLWVLVLAFAAAMVLVGRMKGLRALLGVTYTLLIILLFTLQAIYHGFSSLPVTILTITVSAAMSLVLLNGVSERTLSGLLATLSGVAVTGIVFQVFSVLLRISGFNLQDYESLQMVSMGTGMTIKGLLLSGVLISALGAVMDVAVSLAAAIDELTAVNPALTRADLFRSGMNIGKDMIGTMSNTLILAYAGTSMTTLLVLMSLGYQFNQLLSSDLITIELARGICSTIGVVLTVPAGSLICAALYSRREEKVN